MEYKLINFLDKFQKNKKAIAAITVNNMETIKSSMEVSLDLDTPIILMVSPSGIKYFGGIKNLVDIFNNLKKELKSDKTFLHLDHALDKNICFKAIELGFDSVMFDGSKLSLDENIKITKEIVDYAHERDILVEGEIGEVGGKEDDVEAEINLAKSEDIIHFYNKTKVDLLAASIGTAHGVYSKKPNIKFDLLKELKSIDAPLVLHGSSGLSEETLRKLILEGEVKINVNTKNQQQLIEGLKSELKSAKLNDIRDLNNIMMKYFKKSIRETVRLFTNV